MLTHWLLAVRPKTLTLSLSPLLIGAALAHSHTGDLLILPWVAALLAAILIQAATNLHNDAADYEKGTDTQARIGPRRAANEGWLSVAQIKRAVLLCFLGAFLIGLYLTWHGGWPILALGLGSIAAGYAYTGGPRPIAYTPLGELFVLTFFGVAAVGGTYYLQTNQVNWQVIALGVIVGLPAAAVLLLNNYRDLETDTQGGRRTLVFYLGRPASRWLYGLMLLSPLAVPLALNQDEGWTWLAWLATPLALWLIWRLSVQAIDQGLNRLLALTAQYQLVLTVLLSIGLAA